MENSKLIAAVVAGTIAITSSVSLPAHASSNSDNLAKILLGAAAIGVVAHSIKKKNKRRAPVARYDTYPRHSGPRHSGEVYHQQRPKTCLRKRYTNHGWKTYYSQKCLKQYRNRSHSNHAHSDRRFHGHNDNHRHDHNYGRRHRHDTYNAGRHVHEWVSDK